MAGTGADRLLAARTFDADLAGAALGAAAGYLERTARGRTVNTEARRTVGDSATDATAARSTQFKRVACLTHTGCLGTGYVLTPG